MELPAYQLRIISETEATVFSVSLNDQRRINWERCASLSLETGEINMQGKATPPQALRAYCEQWQASIARAKKDNQPAYKALTAIGQLAEVAGKLEAPIDSDLFEILIWSEASLKDVLIANKGLALLAEDDQEKYILQGQHHMNEGQYSLAEKEYVKALEYKSNLDNVYSFLAISLERQGKIAEAAEAINKGILANPRAKKFLMRGAHYNLDAANLEKAQSYIKTLAKMPGIPGAQRLQLSRLAMRAEMKALGKEIAQEIVAQDSANEQALEHLVNIVASTENEAAVFKIISQHVKATPKVPKMKEWYIRALIAQDNLEQAYKVTKDWTAKEGQNFAAQFQLGRVSLLMQKPRSAARALAIADKISPNHAPTQKLIADAYIALDDLAGAMEASGKACKLNPQNANFQNQAKLITNLLLAQSNKST